MKSPKADRVLSWETLQPRRTIPCHCLQIPSTIPVSRPHQVLQQGEQTPKSFQDGIVAIHQDLGESVGKLANDTVYNSEMTHF